MPYYNRDAKGTIILTATHMGLGFRGFWFRVLGFGSLQGPSYKGAVLSLQGPSYQGAVPSDRTTTGLNMIFEMIEPGRLAGLCCLWIRRRG